MPVLTEGAKVRVPSLSQRQAQAISRITETVRRSDAKLLAASVVEAAAEEVERNPTFVRTIQIMYDALAATTKPTGPKPPTTRPRKQLIPVVSAGEIVIGRDDKPDAYVLQRLYGNAQLRDALEGYTLATLKEMAAVVMQRNPGTEPTSKRTKASIIDYIVSTLTGAK